MAPSNSLQIIARRPDGVIAISVGDRQVVLANVAEGLKTHPFDSLLLAAGTQRERYGPWIIEDDVTISEAARARAEVSLNRPGHHTTPEQIGPVDHRLVLPRDAPTRADLVAMLTSAHVDVEAELPAVIALQDDPVFFAHCMTELVPTMQAGGVTVGNPVFFCSVMYAQRTGLMPHGTADDEAAEEIAEPPAMTMPPVPDTIEMAAPPPKIDTVVTREPETTTVDLANKGVKKQPIGKINHPGRKPQTDSIGKPLST